MVRFLVSAGFRKRHLIVVYFDLSVSGVVLSRGGAYLRPGADQESTVYHWSVDEINFDI